MTEKVKAAVSYPPAPTGQDQPPETRTINTVTQPDASLNKHISTIDTIVPERGTFLHNGRFAP